MKRMSILVLTAAAAALGACSHSPEELYYASRAHREIQPVEVMAELRLDTAETQDRLGQEGRAAVRKFAASYRDEGSGPIVVQRPRSDGSEAAGLRLAGEIRAVLLAEGIHAEDISEGSYDAANASASPMLLTYSAWEAQAPDCPTMASLDARDTRSNTALPSFGCAVTANLAAMLADPSDLLSGQEMDPPDGGRRGDVYRKYRAGQDTSAQKSADAKGTISNALGN